MLTHLYVSFNHLFLSHSCVASHHIPPCELLFARLSHTFLVLVWNGI